MKTESEQKIIEQQHFDHKLLFELLTRTAKVECDFATLKTVSNANTKSEMYKIINPSVAWYKIPTEN